MLFWIVAAAMTAGVVLLIVPPLIKTRGEADSRSAYDLEVYRDQLDELDRDVARGLVSEVQAAAARAEIGRRMLAVAATSDDDKPSTPKAAPRSAKVLAALLAVALPLGALAVYTKSGRPDVPAQPLASRNLEQERGAPSKTVLAAMDKLKNQLEQNPNDPQGWSILGQAYAKMGRYQEAADALRKAVGLSQGDIDILGSYAEVLTSANGGTVPADAKTAFDAILEKDPKEPRARFYAALARFQAGDLKDALERWRTLMAESPADAPWVPLLQGQIRQVAQALNLDPAAVTPKPLPPEQPPTAQGGGAGAGAAGDGAAPQDQQAMIQGMVASLEAKLEANPEDVNGWLMLARSYAVLGDGAKAVEAARKARDRAPQRPDVLVAYASALLSAQSKADAAAMPGEVVAALRQALSAEPANRDALWLLGLDAAGSGRTAEASELWGRLLAQFQPSDPEYALIRARLDQLKAGG